MPDDYEYDVAFSFNALDEGVASQLNDLLADRIKQLQTNFQKSELGVTAANVAYEEFSTALEISTSKLKDVGVTGKILRAWRNSRAADAHAQSAEYWRSYLWKPPLN